MFLRWKKRQLSPKGWERKRDTVLYAYLVANSRENGNVKQKTICYVGSIGEKYLSCISHQYHFWSRLNWHLDDLHVGAAEREVIANKVLAIVPLPAQEEYEKEKERLTVLLSAYNRGIRSMYKK